MIEYLVLAGNPEQFENWRHKNKVHSSRAKYIMDSSSLRGCRNVTIVKTGTYYERKDLREILDYISHMEATS